MQLLDIDELAEIFKRSPASTINDMARDSKSMPPRVIFPGKKFLRWRQEDVENWLGQHVQQSGD